MDELIKLLTVPVALLTLAGALVTLFVWKFLIPREIQKQSREESNWYETRLAAKDKHLAELRVEHEELLVRLARDEQNFERLQARFEKLAVWKLEAERYMRQLDVLLKRQGVAPPNRADFGLNGD